MELNDELITNQYSLVLLSQQLQQMMLDEVEKFKFEIKNGNYYQLINKSNNKALSVRQCSNYTKQQPEFSKPDQEDVHQIWMIEKVKEDQWEIVHAKSTLVIEDFGKAMKLTFGDWKNSQLFYLEKCPNATENQYVFRDKKGSDKYICAEDPTKIGVKTYNSASNQIVWVLKIADKTKAITSSVILQNAMTNQSMDVPEASDKSGVRIIQYTINRRFNQRWRLVRFNDLYYRVFNVKSGMCLDVYGASEKEGANIIQYSPSEGANQLWNIEYQGKGLYIFRSAMNSNIMIGIKNNSSKEGTELVTTFNEDYALWRFIGGEFQRKKIVYI